MTRDDYVNSIKSAFVLLGTKAVMTELVTLTGFFALPLIGPLTNWAVERILTLVATKAETQAFFLFIDMRVAEQGRDFESAAMNYWKLTQGTDLRAIKEAENELIKKFIPLVKFAS
jgi:hypothetical protein